MLRYSHVFWCVEHIYNRYGRVTVVVIHTVRSPVFAQKEHHPCQWPTDAGLVRLLGRDQHEQHGELMPQDAACQQPWCNPTRHWLRSSSCQGRTWRPVVRRWRPCRDFWVSWGHETPAHIDCAQKLTRWAQGRIQKVWLGANGGGGRGAVGSEVERRRRKSSRAP